MGSMVDNKGLRVASGEMVAEMRRWLMAMREYEKVKRDPSTRAATMTKKTTRRDQKAEETRSKQE
jgi:hypothetical protein